jgi:hypothetical protein
LGFQSWEGVIYRHLIQKTLIHTKMQTTGNRRKPPTTGKTKASHHQPTIKVKMLRAREPEVRIDGKGEVKVKRMLTTEGAHGYGGTKELEAATAVGTRPWN